MTLGLVDPSAPLVPSFFAAVEAHPLVLLAAADALAREQLADRLRGVGYAVLEASSRAELLGELRRRLDFDRVRRPPVDLLIASRDLDDGPGLDAVRLLRTRGWATPVLLAARGLGPEQRAEAMRLGSVSILDGLDDAEEVLDYVHAVAPPFLRRG